MKTQIEIILETLRHYLEDPSRRAAMPTTGVFDNCQYQLDRPDGTVCYCAVGRCLKPEALEVIHAVEVQPLGLVTSARRLLSTVKYEHKKNGGDPDECSFATFDDLLKPEYHGHPVEFWTQLQELHDDPANWPRAEADKVERYEVGMRRHASVHRLFGWEAAEAARAAGLVDVSDQC